MSNIQILYYLRDALACLGVLVGLGGAVFLFIRRKTLPAILALIGWQTGLPGLGCVACVGGGFIITIDHIGDGAGAVMAAGAKPISIVVG